MNLFGTAGIRGDARERVTPELALAVGKAVGVEASRPQSSATAPGDGEPPEFVVGRDGRETGPALVAAIEAGLEAAGTRVLRVGEVPTPALAFASQGRRGVMVTASHNPPTDNGLKLFHDGEEYDRGAERRVEASVPEETPNVTWDAWGGSERVDVLQAYKTAVVDYATGHGAALDGLRVAIDCGTGTGGIATPQVLRSLGGHVVALNAQVDGHFPGRESKPTPESLRDLRAFVRGERHTEEGDANGHRTDGFDIGFGHDGDADRIVVVDSDGKVVHEDTVLAILAEYFVRVSNAAQPVVVTTPNASARIDERVRASGGRVERVRLGALHEGIAAVTTNTAADRADESADTASGEGESGGEVVFAGEPWKHVHPAHGPWIDGVASAAILARLVAEKGLSSLRDPVTERPYRKLSVDCPDDKKAAVMADLAESLPAEFPDAVVSTEHGIRLERPDNSWVLVRPSGTEPYVRIYAESENVDALVERTRAVVEAAT